MLIRTSDWHFLSYLSDCDDSKMKKWLETCLFIKSIPLYTSMLIHKIHFGNIENIA